MHKEEKFEEEILEEDEAEVNLSKLDEEILEVSNVANSLTIIILYGGCMIKLVVLKELWRQLIPAVKEVKVLTKLVSTK